eukprot:8680971-Pyramimonas_sp.AAC.1
MPAWPAAVGICLSQSRLARSSQRARAHQEQGIACPAASWPTSFCSSMPPAASGPGCPRLWVRPMLPHICSPSASTLQRADRRGGQAAKQ